MTPQPNASGGRDFEAVLNALGMALAILNCGPKHAMYSEKEISKLREVFQAARPPQMEQGALV